MNYKELQEKITKLEKKYSKDFKKVFQALEYLLQGKTSEENFKNRERIGFKKQ